MWRWFAKAALWLGMILSAGVSRGEGVPIKVTLPLDGYFRPGRYMPVHVVAAAPQDPHDYIAVEASLSVWTFLGCEGGKVDTVVPLMPIGPQAETNGVWVNWAMYPGPGAQLPLHMLAANQALVGYAGAAISAADAMRLAKQVDAGKQWISAPLDMWQPVPGAGTMWETLDLLVLDSATLRRIDATKMASLVSGGVGLLVQSERAPDGLWPWEQKGAGWWLLRYIPAGPDATYTPAAFEVVPNLKGGLTAWQRWRVVVYAVVVEAIILLLVLIGRRWLGVWWGILFAIIAIATIIYLGRWQREVRSVEGTVEITGPHITQDDTWEFQSCPSKGYSRLRWVDGLHLVIASPDQWARMGVRVTCYPTGTPDTLEFSLMPDQKAAVFARRCGPHGPSLAPSPHANSPMRLLATELYMKKGDQIVGERPGTPILGEGYYKSEMWPTVVVERDATARP